MTKEFVPNRLYNGLLEKFLYRKLTYCPHITVGRILDEKKFDKVIDELSAFNENFETVIDKVFVENIDMDEKSIIEFEYNLG